MIVGHNLPKPDLFQHGVVDIDVNSIIATEQGEYHPTRSKRAPLKISRGALFLLEDRSSRDLEDRARTLIQATRGNGVWNTLRVPSVAHVSV